MARTQKQVAATNKQKRRAFLNGAKVNGTSGMETFARELAFWNEFGDWRGMAELLTESHKTDSDQFRKMVTECLDASWSFKAGKFVRNKEYVAESAEAMGNSRGIFEDALAKFAKFASEGVSFRGYKKLKSEDDRTDEEKNEARLAKLLADALRICQKQDMTVEQFADRMRLLKIEQADAA